MEIVTAIENHIVLFGAALAASVLISKYAWRGARAVYGFVRLAVRVMNLIAYELQPNAGKSLRDAVDRIERMLEIGGARFARIEEHVGLEPFQEPIKLPGDDS